MFSTCEEAFLKALVFLLKPQVLLSPDFGKPPPPPSPRWRGRKIEAARMREEAHAHEGCVCFVRNRPSSRLAPLPPSPPCAAFKWGDMGTRMFFIQRGQMQILSEDLGRVLCSLFAGSYFGELAMLTSQVRVVDGFEMSASTGKGSVRPSHEHGRLPSPLFPLSPASFHIPSRHAPPCSCFPPFCSGGRRRLAPRRIASSSS